MNYKQIANNFYKRFFFKIIDFDPFRTDRSLSELITVWVRIFFILIPLISGFIILIIYYSYSTQIATSQNDMLDVIRVSLVENLESAMLTKDFLQVRKSLDSIRDLEFVDEVLLIDRERKVVISDDMKNERKFLNYPSLAEALNKGEEIQEKIRLSGNDKNRLILPFLNKPKCQSCHPPSHKVLGGLVVTFSTIDAIGRTRNFFIFFVLFFGLLIYVTKVLFKHLAERNLNVPVQKLILTTKNISKGEFNGINHIESPREFKYLSQAINKMANDIQDYVEEIKKTHSEKEQIKVLAGIGEMAAKVAHEVRNPLNTMDGAVHFLKQTYTEHATLKEYLALIEENVQRINNVASELLDATRPAKPVLEKVNIVQLLRDRINDCSEKSMNNQVEINIKALGHIPLIFVDKHQIIQVIDNLLENALDACEDRESSVITIRAKKISPTPMHNILSIKICDNGMGISKEKLKQIFTPFYTDKPNGTGLGLAIVEKIILNHRGQIKILSRENKGTIVTVRIPIRT